MTEALKITSLSVILSAILMNLVILTEAIVYAYFRGSVTVIIIYVSTAFVLWCVLPEKYTRFDLELWRTFFMVQGWMLYSLFFYGSVFHFSYFNKFLSVVILVIVGASYYEEWFANHKQISMGIIATAIPAMLFFPPADIFVSNGFFRWIIIRVILFSGTRTLIEIDNKSGVNHLVHQTRPQFDARMVEFKSLWILFLWNWASLFGFASVLILGRRIEALLQTINRSKN